MPRSYVKRFHGNLIPELFQSREIPSINPPSRPFAHKLALALAGAETGRGIWTIATATTAAAKITTSSCNPPNDQSLLLPPWPGAFAPPPNSHPPKWLQTASSPSSLGIIYLVYISCSYLLIYLGHPSSGHTRPVTQLSFSSLQDDGTYLLVSSCKDGKPMLRDWTGDWIGTFMGAHLALPLPSRRPPPISHHILGHKGAVWSSKLSSDTSRAVTGSADFTALVVPT